MPVGTTFYRRFLGTMIIMRDTYEWAFWRRFWYGTGFGIFWALVFFGVYMLYLYEPANCFDGVQNGNERGVDCGGSCVRICATDVIEPTIRWAQSFRVREGQFNAVAYIENRNTEAATPVLPYTFSLYDSDGLIVESSGTTILPPDSVYPVFLGPIRTGDRVPTNTFIELGGAELWLPAVAGRNQFTIADRQLVGIDQQPRLTARIQNTALTPAEDVEVIATIFDARGNALTSSRTFVEYVGPQSEERLVFTWPEPIARTIRSCEVPTDVVLAIDLSGSMNDDQDTPPEPVTSVLQAAEAFASRLKERDQAAVVTFATEAAVTSSLSNDVTAVAQSIGTLSIAPSEEVGSTNTGDAFVRTLNEFNSVRHNNEARKVMVILTDGLATAPAEEPEAYAIEQAEMLKASGVEVYAIGLGENVDMEFVRTIATDRDHAYQALSRTQVDRIYETITGAICEDGPAVIEVIPKTEAGFQSLR